MSTGKNSKNKIIIKKIRKFWSRYEGKIVLFLGIFLVTAISFQLGVLQGQKWQPDPLIIERVPDNHVEMIQKVLGESSEKNSESEVSKLTVEKSEPSQKTEECMFIGSKNSDKYHKIGCRSAGRIKSENIVCFKNVEDARSKGYISASCMK